MAVQQANQANKAQEYDEVITGNDEDVLINQVPGSDGATVSVDDNIDEVASNGTDVW